ncbi:MAG: histidine kinase [Cyclobacteriaceae bacterium]
MKVVRLILPAIFFTLWFSSIGQVNYTIEDGLPSNKVYRVYQSKQGYLWLCTDRGLSRYDGRTFKNYTTEDGLPDNVILDVYEDSIGRIWLFSMNGVLGYITNESPFEVFVIANLEARITGITENELGEVWVTSLSGKIISISTGSEFHEISNEFDQITGMIRHKSEIYVITDRFNSYKNGTFSQIDAFRNTAFNSVRLICFKGNIAWATVGYYRPRLIDLESGTQTFFPKPYRVLNFQVLNESLYALTTNGVFVDPFDKDTQLYDINNATDIVVDNLGNTWVSSLSDGIYFYLNERNRFGKLIDANVDFVVTDTALLAVDNNYLYSIKENLEYKTSLINTRDQTSHFIKYIETDKQGQIVLGLIGSLNYGGHEIETKSQRAFTDAFETFWYASLTEIVNVRRPDFKVEKTISWMGASCLLFTSDDELIIGNDDGLYVIDGDTIIPYLDDATAGVGVRDVKQDMSGDIWAITEGNGLLRIKNKAIETYSDHNSSISSFPTSLTVFDESVWVGGLGSISRVIASPDSVAIDLIMPIDLRNQIVTKVDIWNDLVLVMTDRGLFYAKNNLKFKNDPPLSLMIGELEIDDVSNEVVGNHTFSHDVNNINWKFECINLSGQSDLSYQYSLQNTDGEIINELVTSSSQYALVNPKGGDYVLSVKVKNLNSDWSKALRAHFEIEHAFYTRWWFFVITILLTSLAVSAIYYLVIKRKHKIAQLQQSLSKAKLEGLRAQINPHFLFNSLNSINNQILNGRSEDANIFLSKMSMLMRRILDHSENLFVNLHDEVDLLRLYLEIEQMRMSGKFKFDIVIDGSVDVFTTQIPAMVIQPIVENAVWHGVAPLNKGGLITIRFSEKHNLIQVVVEDNGRGFDPSLPHKKSSKGQKLIEERLRLLGAISEGKVGYTYATDSMGTKVYLSLPVNQ